VFQSPGLLTTEGVMNLRLWAVVAAGVLVAADTPKGDAVKEELAKFQGGWQLVSGVINGNPIPDDDAKQIERKFDGDKFEAKKGGMTLTKGTVKIDPTKKPKAVDVQLSQSDGGEVTLKGIYELDGDTMKTCLAPPDHDRPTDFTSKEGSGLMSYVWKRAKKEKGGKDEDK
jgi:uncharacterized protein (TIGR03067 family)